MPSYPSDSNDTVVYNGEDIYVPKDSSVTVFEDSRMFLFGEWYLNGNPITTGDDLPFFSVSDFGAKGDGVTDDTVAIQAAINAAGVKGGCVSFGSGPYVVGNIVCGPFVSLRGAGQYSSHLVCKTGTTGNWFQMSVGSEVSSLWFDANLQNVTALYLWRAARSMYHHLYMSNGGPISTAIWVQGDGTATASHANKFSDISIIGFGSYGMVLHDFAYDSELVNVWIGTCGIGMRCVSGAQQLTGCHIWGCTGDGLFLDPGLGRIVNCYFESNGGAGLHAKNAAFRGGLSVIGCVIWKNTTNGIWLETGYRSRIIGCVLEDNTGPGILVDSHSNCIIEGCQSNNSVGTTPQTCAVQETGTSDNNIFIGNMGLDSNHSSSTVFDVIGTRTIYFGNKTSTLAREMVLMSSMTGQGGSASIESPAGQASSLILKTGSSFRWLIQKSITAETGSNVGSDLIIGARTDAGGFLSSPLLIRRSSGQAEFSGNISIADAKDIILGNTTGTKIGTSGTAKLSFYGATPIVRPTVAAAATDAATTQALVNSLRTALIALGLVS